jgi:low affinity Fe/Cu permease
VGRWFERFAAATAHAMGEPWAFVLSVLLVVAWAASGPLFGFSDTWQLVINTSTTVITFWMVFVIQNTQNRDTAAIKAMLVELVKKLPEADSTLAEEVERASKA